MLSRGRNSLIALLMLSSFYSPLTIAAELPLSSDYYQRLDVAPNASSDEIKKSFRKLAMKYHPDRHPEMDRVLFQNINEAWDILQDDAKRTAYDRARSATMASAKKPEPAKAQPQAKPKPEPTKSAVDSKSIFMAIVKATDERSLAAAVAQAEALDWKDAKIEKMFLSFAEPLIKTYISPESAKLTVEETANLVRMIENLFSLSKMGQYPQFFESILKSPRAGYFTKNILSQSLWMKHPETKNWIVLAMKSESPAATRALMTVFLEKLRTPQAQKAFIQQLIRQTPKSNLTVIAETIPLASEATDFSQELRLLVSKNSDTATDILGSRLNKYLAGPLKQAPPEDYYRLGYELHSLVRSCEKAFAP